MIMSAIKPHPRSLPHVSGVTVLAWRGEIGACHNRLLVGSEGLGWGAVGIGD